MKSVGGGEITSYGELRERLAFYADETLGYLRVSRLPVWTFNKTISKICDSYRVEAGVKDILRKMRKNKH